MRDAAHLLFPLHQFQIAGIGGQLPLECLKRHDPAGDLVAGAVDFARSAAAKHTLDLVGIVEYLVLAEDVTGQWVDHLVTPNHAVTIHQRHAVRIFVKNTIMWQFAIEI
ncbi:UNVERIFIED_ORG: hypothetical protein GGE53_000586 [Rhizobium etli]